MVQPQKKYDVFDDSLESFYWIGFLFADGSFVQKRYIAVSLSIDDIDHLNKFKQFTKSNNKIFSKSRKSGYKSNRLLATFRIGDKFTIEKLCEKFNIHTNKTKNPPHIRVMGMTDEQFIAVIVGFIDGDGTIFRKREQYDNFAFRLKVHSSWLNNLNIIIDNIKKISGIRCKSVATINKQGYAQLNVDNTKILKFLKRFIIVNKLPVMERKWAAVPSEMKLFETLANHIKPLIKKLRADGHTLREIQEYLHKNHNIQYNLSTIRYHSIFSYQYD